MDDNTKPLVAELLPCPFCGATKAIDKDDLGGVWLETNGHDDPDYHVQCWICGAQSRAMLSQAEASAAWNTRVPIKRLQALAGELAEQLEDAIKRLATCAELSGNPDWVIDAMLAPHRETLRKFEELTNGLR